MSHGQTLSPSTFSGLPSCPLVCNTFECVESENNCDKSLHCGYSVDDITCSKSIPVLVTHHLESCDLISLIVYLSACEDQPGIFNNLAVYLLGSEVASCSILDSCTGVRCSSSSNSLLVEFVECNSNPGVRVILKNHSVLTYGHIITGSTQLDDTTGKADILNFTVTRHSSESNTLILQVIVHSHFGLIVNAFCYAGCCRHQ